MASDCTFSSLVSESSIGCDSSVDSAEAVFASVVASVSVVVSADALFAVVDVPLLELEVVELLVSAEFSPPPLVVAASVAVLVVAED